MCIRDRPGAGLLRPERTEILAPGDRSRDDRLPESQGEKRSCVPGEKQGFRVYNAGEEKATRSIDESLRKLRTDYIDLLLIHQPFSDYPGTWRAMEKA